MKKTVGILLAFCLFWLSVSVTDVYAAPEVSAEAVVLMEAATGVVLYEKNAREMRSMASTTKIMTTLLTIESGTECGDLDIEFQVDNAAIHVEGSSMGLQDNDIVTKRALCYGMLLPSGNDAANAAAVAVAGSIPDFAVLMNKRAQEIGMTATHFVTPSGLEGEGHGASAYDMALLAREAMRNELFRSICCEQAAKVYFGNPPYERTLYNSNKLLAMYEGTIGIKTGFTDEAGRCLVSACERDGVTLLCVTLHAPSDWDDHMKLYDYGFSRIRCAELPMPSELTMPITGGEADSVRLYQEEPVTIGALNGIPSGIRTVVRCAPFAYAPVCEGDVLGELVYYYQEREIMSVPLLATENVAAKEIKQKHKGWKLWDWFQH